MKVPKGKKVYRGAKVYKEGQECPFLKEETKPKCKHEYKPNKEKGKK